jgi:uncharacterized membrane protein HdeD (DUF308 family)
MSDEATERLESAVTRSGLTAYWGLIFTYGMICIGLGVVLAVWPDESLVVCAVLIAIQLLIAGVLRIVLAIGSTTSEGGVRVLMGLTGALALVVGLLCLRDPAQTILIVSMLLGFWWLVSGVVDVITAFVAPSGSRVWDLVSGGVSIVAGGFLLVDPKLSLGVLVLVTCIWLFLVGLAAIVAAFKLRAVGRQAGPAVTSHRASPSSAHAV